MANLTAAPPALVPRPKRGLDAVAGLGLAVWFGAMTAISVAIMFKHLVPLDPGDARRTERAMSDLARVGSPGWTVVHVLSADCACSIRVAHHLTGAPRPAGLHEQVLLVGQAPELEALITQAGLELRHVEPAELLATFGLDAAPLLVVADPAHKLRYVGGYTQRKQSYAIEDDRILDELRRGRVVAPLPVFGCALSPTRKPTKDLLGI